MNLSSHILLTYKVTKRILPKKYVPVILFASIWPDIDRRTQPHRENNLLFHIYNSQRKLLNSKNNYCKSFELGILMHYVCDYYCYAHNYNLDISHGIAHIKYEIALHNLLKTNFKKRIQNNFNDADFIAYIVSEKTNYDNKISTIERDLKYILSICENAVSHYVQFIK